MASEKKITADSAFNRAPNLNDSNRNTNPSPPSPTNKPASIKTKIPSPLLSY